MRADLPAACTLCALLALGAGPIRAQIADPAMRTDRNGAADTACMVRLSSADMVGPAEDLARVIDLQDSTARASFLIRRAGHPYQANACAASPAVAELARAVGTVPHDRLVDLIPAELLVVGNSAYPRDWNDGVLWGGRGLNVAATAGVEMRWHAFSAAIAPVFAWQPNAAYDIHVIADTSASPFKHPWHGNSIDAPQRFGAEPFSSVDPGQSFARIDVRGFGVGISTQNLRWGPARRNPVLLSGTAPGFAHAFLETGRPVDIWIGDLEFQLFWGRLEESDYFDDDPDNDDRLLAGLLVAFQPRIFDGLAIGGARTQSFTWWPDLSWSEVLLRPYRGLSENPQGRELGDNQLLTFFFRWSAAPFGMEAYGEWAREDHWEGTAGLFRNLDSSQGYTIGLQKLVRRGDDVLRIGAEVTHLADALPGLFGGRPGHIAFYTNTSVRQGHTHRGQMLGAPIGTGAESQWLGADYFWSGGRTSLSIERARYESERYQEAFAPRFGAAARDVEFSVRTGHLMSFGDLSAHAEIGWSTRRNRAFLGLATLTSGGTFRRDDNWNLRFGARWSPGAANR